ncbi:MAG: dTDP-4-amino-4,6-dideoxygalactose transaminase, partial [Bacteroidia bacterium]|nr:dTDP-4-amino-4,6-dideoxygalactose transaminase [Bacteroidia bacterium]
MPFNKPYLTGRESYYLEQVMRSGKLSGNGMFTTKCNEFFESVYQFKKVFLTTSCTDALEMAALLLNIKEGDEVIAPSYTFVSTVNPFVLRGAKIVFADSNAQNPNIDASRIEELITERTKAIIPVHYSGIACDMDAITDLAKKYDLQVVEDAAHSIDSFYKNIPLGKLGALSAFSFHDTKNIISGEGGMLVINDEKFIERAEMIRENGTNRSRFFRGEVSKYGWMDIGSSFLPSELIAAFLFAQTEHLTKIQQKRKAIWQQYYQSLSVLQKEGRARLPHIPSFATNNAHLFYLVSNNSEERNALIGFLKSCGIGSAFHYLSLHQSDFYKDRHGARELPLADLYSNCLIRLPMYYELEPGQ